MQFSFFMDTLIVECEELLIMKYHQNVEISMLGYYFLLFSNLFT